MAPGILALMLIVAGSAHAQSGFPSKTTVQIRLGAFLTTPLVKDAVSSSALDDSIPGQRSNEITIQQEPSPIATAAVRFPLRTTTQLELNGSIARSRITGEDGYDKWDVTTATVANLVIGFGYLYRDLIALRAGVGVTRLFAEERALFSKGNGIKPLLEGGISTGFAVAGRPIEIDLRAQSHGFSTATLRDDGGSAGNVTRAVLQIGTTLWQAGR